MVQQFAVGTEAQFAYERIKRTLKTMTREDLVKAAELALYDSVVVKPAAINGLLAQLASKPRTTDWEEVARGMLRSSESEPTSVDAQA
jgi:20S proteasome alpha/beta subunit